MATGARANNRDIVAVGDNDGLKALDHKFHNANLVLSGALHSNNTDSVAGSFFTGDEDGMGQLFVTLRDAIFDPSHVFDHCAQLIEMLKMKCISPNVLELQTDGGPDHALKRVAVKLALIATFIKLDIDHFVITYQVSMMGRCFIHSTILY